MGLAKRLHGRRLHVKAVSDKIEARNSRPANSAVEQLHKTSHGDDGGT
jgi:hypothetical protein